jgi:hypothetical protein
MIECNLIVDPPAIKTASGYRLPGGGPLLEGGGEKGGYDPKDIQSAYKIPAGGSGQTVALIDAYGYSAAESDLAKYREKYELAACTKTSGCFKQVNQKGEEANYPAESGILEKEWSAETALDMDMVSAACPSCKILLVEATTQSSANTAASVEEAAKLKATEISNSYGYAENDEVAEACPGKKGCKEYLAAYDQAGIPITAAAGDSGYDDGRGAPSWPAISPNVIAVGGTNLKKAENARGWSETVWKGSGSGCSLYEAKPAWQTDSGCSLRTDDDVAAVASPETPVSIYNTPYFGGWENLGGTSASSPLIAAIMALTNNYTRSLGADAFYQFTGALFDVTSGQNGECGTYLCNGEVGYDGPTGLGTPNGLPTEEWELQSTPNPASAKSSRLLNISCTSSTACTGVGDSINSTGTEATLGERWNGTSWAIQTTASPTGATASELLGVSCTSATACTAVGYYDSSKGTKLTLAEGWNGTTWTTQTPETPTGASASELTAVSCTSSTACTAVGEYVNGAGTEVTLAERWNGTAWSVQSTTNPTGATASALLGVSCTSSTACTAVGDYYNSAGTRETLGEGWNGTAWSTQTTQNPTGATSNILLGVSCTSSTACTAVGADNDPSQVTLVERWNGTTWATEESPNPSGALASVLHGVSCATSTACTAVGDYDNAYGTNASLTEGWNGTKWTLQPIPNPVEFKFAALWSVSCTAATTCLADGYYKNKAGTELTLAANFIG